LEQHIRNSGTNPIGTGRDLHHKSISIFLILRLLANHKKNWSTGGSARAKARESAEPCRRALNIFRVKREKIFSDSRANPSQAVQEREFFYEVRNKKATILGQSPTGAYKYLVFSST